MQYECQINLDSDRETGWSFKDRRSMNVPDLNHSKGTYVNKIKRREA